MSDHVDVDIEGRALRLSNLDKVLWPDTGFTKGQMIDYYTRVAPALVPHLAGRAITLRRWPNGVAGKSFFEKNCPSHRPNWVETVQQGDVAYCRVDEPATVVWMANLAAIELHPTLGRAPDLDTPTAVVFDLDPGPPADAITCAEVATLLRELFERLGLRSWVKTSGSKGLQLYVPLNTDVTFDAARDFALASAKLLEQEHPRLVVTTQERAVRKGKVLIDWSQNTATKTTVSVYSIRAVAAPSVSTPITWDELDAARTARDLEALRFGPDEVLARLDAQGDLLAPILTLTQRLPALPGDEESTPP
ncbi:MAG: non-homologous end-joining DNA ligase [Acidimicrobiaceae bacterium]|nr:non-homologous end-joining DNA ligase [Acidimicrobiaceae bacterium]